MSLKLNTASGGSISLQETNTASNLTITLPATTGTALIAPTALTVPNTTGTVMVSGNMPAFSAYLNGNQTGLVASTYTLVQLGGEDYDTGSCFNNTGSTVTLNGLSVPAYSFCPNVAGYYQINGMIGNDASSSPPTTLFTIIYKNGSQLKTNNSYIQGYFAIGISSLVYLNGTGDYVNLYGYQGTLGTGTPRFDGNATSGQAPTWFNGALVRTA